MSQRSDRNSNIERLRVLSMLMIIVLHYLWYSGALENVPNGEMKYYIVWVIEACCYVSVNCYMLISGFFLCNSKFKVQKIVDIVIRVVFYSVGIYLLFCACGLEQFNVKTLITAYMFPITHGQYWYATAYVAIYMMFPFLNRFINGLKRKQHIICIIIGGVLFSVIPSVCFFYVDIIGIGGGYSLIWFVYVYIVAAYIRIYEHEFEGKRYIYLLIYFLMSFMTAGSKFIQQFLFGKELWNLYNYNSVTILIGAVCLFLFFVQGNGERTKLYITVGKTTFGVFLIHTQYLMRTWLWEIALKTSDVIQKEWYWLIGCLLVDTIIIFVLCSFIDLMRDKLFELIKINRIEGIFIRVQQKVENWLKEE